MPERVAGLFGVGLTLGGFGKGAGAKARERAAKAASRARMEATSVSGGTNRSLPDGPAAGQGKRSGRV
jgi:hypothetical protein